jgi:hypothetical protein|tara:strand:- start:7 stop:489 length:483 start_codon:yes stop_codon:yes gene_type:complete
MHSKNNNKSQTFIQGLRPFSSSIPKTLKKHLRKGGYNYSNIVDNWTKMVSKKIADACYPITVKMGKEMREGTLVLNVIHGKELEVEYEKNEIMDKINSFFGYKCISNVVLKIVQDTVKPKKNFPKIKDFSKIEDKMSKVNDDTLKSSLNNFLKAFNERNN